MDNPKYPVSADEESRLNNNFTYHTPIADQQQRYERIRGQAKVLARTILECCPPSRERSVAMTELETAIFWANASIARNETE